MKANERNPHRAGCRSMSAASTGQQPMAHQPQDQPEPPARCRSRRRDEAAMPADEPTGARHAARPACAAPAWHWRRNPGPAAQGAPRRPARRAGAPRRCSSRNAATATAEHDRAAEQRANQRQVRAHRMQQRQPAVPGRAAGPRARASRRPRSTPLQRHRRHRCAGRRPDGATDRQRARTEHEAAELRQRQAFRRGVAH